MKEISESTLFDAVYRAAAGMCFKADEQVEVALKIARDEETHAAAKAALDDIVLNAKIAREKHIPLCQDTGIVIVFADVGTETHIACDFEKTVNAAIAKAYCDEYLRKSVVASPITRINTKNNTPAVFHVRLTCGDKVRITLYPKGAGSENMGGVRMLPPAAGAEGAEEFVVETVKNAGGKACPPLIVGVGIGGDMEECALLSKRALLRPLGDSSPVPELMEMETRLKKRINDLGVGAMGLGGKTTALAVKVEAAPCHIASLPVAVSLCCHAARHSEIIL